jgi:hypothetical protein
LHGLSFMDLLEVKRTQSFCHAFFQEIEDHEKKSTGNTTRAKIGPTTRAKSQTMWWGPSFALWVQLLQSLPLRNRLDLSWLYIPPVDFVMGRHRNT